MEGTACCYGGATIVNGIVCGKGASFSIGLKTTAKVKLTNEPGRFDVRILSDMTEDDGLSKACVAEVLRYFGLESEYGGKLLTRSDIPISRGLKSSSASANAIILATLKALDEQLNDMEIINLGVNAAIKANVTITGAFDDACATYFGCLVMADNQQRRIIKQVQY